MTLNSRRSLLGLLSFGLRLRKRSRRKGSTPVAGGNSPQRIDCLLTWLNRTKVQCGPPHLIYHLFPTCRSPHQLCSNALLDSSDSQLATTWPPPFRLLSPSSHIPRPSRASNMANEDLEAKGSAQHFEKESIRNNSPPLGRSLSGDGNEPAIVWQTWVVVAAASLNCQSSIPLTLPIR